METDIFKHIKIIIYKVFVGQNDKATQKVGQSFFSLVPSDNHDLLVRRQFSLVSDKR
jgi:hypothetical protein